MLSFRHRSLSAPGAGGVSWNRYWILVPGAGTEPDEIWAAVDRFAEMVSNGQAQYLVRAEILRPQPGLDMWYPRGGVRREPRWHWIEYAASRPDARNDYYRDQYVFSAPVIGRFYETGAISRIIGFERQQLLRTEEGMPEWDVVHITGFSPAHLPQIGWTLWRSMPYFDTLAHKIGHSSALDVVRSWDDLRVKYQGIARQERSYTL